MMESKRSCCSTVTCCGMPIERGCFIFSIINAVFCSLSLLGSLGFLVFLILVWLNEYQRSDNLTQSLLWLFTGISMACSVAFVIALAFGIVLCIGVKKNNPRYIMIYLVYGIIAVILSVVGTLGFIWMEWGDVQIMMYTSIPVGICVIYSVMLLLVYQTYVVLSARTPVTGHRRLLNTNDC